MVDYVEFLLGKGLSIFVINVEASVLG